MSEVLWSPSPERREASQLHHFMYEAGEAVGRRFTSYDELHRWSVERYPEFWSYFLRSSGIRFEGEIVPALGKDGMPGAVFFPGVRLSFAENLLRWDDDRPALVSLSESGAPRRLTYKELRREVARVQGALRALGVKSGDRVAAFIPNIAEAVIAMLATTSLGAIWTSCSPDFGVQGVLDRFSQVEPKVLFAANGYVYNGKPFDCSEKIAAIAKGLPTLERIVVIPFLQGHGISAPGVSWNDFGVADAALTLERFPFSHPLYIMYSSGTTGVPKCIVHSAGGTLVQHAKEHLLHCDLRRDDKLIYFTTCGWMMWNWLVSALFTGCTVFTYDGSPSYPSLEVLWRLAESEGITVFGTSAKFIGSCRDKVSPKALVKLDKLRAILSTGSPLLPEDFDWIYGEVKRDVQLASICGGTDIISCFMLGNPLLSVRRGEIQCLGLGMDVAAVDSGGKSVVGEKGELVCKSPFPSMPIGFWRDADGSKYRKAYFDRIPGVWHHGDYVELRPEGGVIVYGRSDATLNPGGVRIGTAEIYRLVETLPEIDDSIVIGQPHEGDVRVVLFVKLASSVQWNELLEARIKKTIREGATPRHVPKIIVPVAKIPYTISGKKTELAVLDVVMGQEPKNKEALADASALDCYRSVV